MELFTNVRIKSEYDQKSYRVVGGYRDKAIAADKMAQLHEFITRFLDYSYQKFIMNGSDGEESDFIRRIIKNYRPANVFENEPMRGEDTSYVSNKGDKFGICLRSKDANAGEFHDYNLLQFVILHELTHLGCKDYGHNHNFYTWFKFVLSIAVSSGLYKPVDYKKYPVRYCGLDVTSNPFCQNNKC